MSDAKDQHDVCLVVVNGGEGGNTYRVEPGENLIGRWDPDAVAYPEIDLTNDDPEIKVSRKHAVVERSDSSITLEDIGSRNGTFLKDGTRLESGRRIELSDGDEFVIGKTVLRLRMK